MWSEWAESDREVHVAVGLVADGDDARIRVGDAARLVLLLGDVVDDVLFGVFVERARHVHRTDDVHLIVFELHVALVHVYDVICVVYSKYAIRCIPMHVHGLGARGLGAQQDGLQADEQDDCEAGRGFKSR